MIESRSSSMMPLDLASRAEASFAEAGNRFALSA
jgi:hypothetical protein